MRDWHREILLAYEQGDNERLSTLLAEARDVARRDVGYLTALGQIFYEQGELQAAMESYTLALHHDPRIAPELLAKVQSVLARYRATSPDPRMPQTRMTPSPLLTHRLEEQPAWQQQAYAFAVSGRGEQAYALLQAHLQQHSDDPDAFVFMAKVFGTQAFWKEGLTSLALALSLRPFHTEALLVRGMLLQEMERYSEALAAYLSVVLLDSTNVEAWEGQAEVILLGGYDPQASLFAYEQALDRDPKREVSLQGKAKVLRTLGRGTQAQRFLASAHREALRDSRTVIIEAWYRCTLDGSDHCCYLCGRDGAEYATDHYLDLEYAMGLALKQDMDPSGDIVAASRKLHDVLHARAVNEQANGIRTCYATTFWCQNCMINLINRQMGHDAGQLFILSSVSAQAKGIHTSAVLFRYLHSLEKNMLLFTSEETVDGFLRQLANSPDLVIDYTRAQAAPTTRPSRRSAHKRKKQRRRER